MANPTPAERKFLRALASINTSAILGGEGWWSAQELRSVPHTFRDFRGLPVLSVAAIGRSCVRKGLAVTRWIGTKGHGWAEWRITSYGRGWVSDSCIGGGLPWKDNGTCPACRSTLAEMGPVSPGDDVRLTPAHPLPGHAPVTVPEGGNPE